MSQETTTVSPDHGTENLGFTWKGLYRIGGAAALICAVMYVITL